MADITPTKQNLELISVDLLDSNSWNPNEMKRDEFQELADEMKRLGRVPKPVVVRRRGDRYEIIDGEHAWRAAKELGFSEVLCEVVEIDDFTARLETLKRNQHGKHCKVREGRMFRKMRKLRRRNNVQLAKLVGVSEGTDS